MSAKLDSTHTAKYGTKRITYSIPKTSVNIKCLNCNKDFLISRGLTFVSDYEYEFGSLLESNPCMKGNFCPDCYVWPESKDYALWQEVNADRMDKGVFPHYSDALERLVKKKLKEYNLLNQSYIFKLLIEVLPKKSYLEHFHSKKCDISTLKENLAKKKLVFTPSTNSLQRLVNDKNSIISKTFSGFKHRNKFMSAAKKLRDTIKVKRFINCNYRRNFYKETDFKLKGLEPILFIYHYKKRRIDERILCINDDSIRGIFLMDVQKLRSALSNIITI